jgi:type II secretory pathway pseudopilin PulG
MKTFAFRHVLLIAAGIIGLALLAFPASAQEANKVQELQRVIEAQQKQMEAQQKQLDAQRLLLQDLQKQMESLVKHADKEGVTVAAAKPPEAPSKPLPEIGGALSQDFKHDRVNPTGSNVTEGISKLNLVHHKI